MKFLYNSTAYFNKPEDDAAARKAAVEAERAKVQVTRVDIKDDEEEKEIEAKEGEDDEQEKEGGEEETEAKGEESEDDKDAKDDELSDEKKLELKAEKKIERLEKKLTREAEKRSLLAKENKELKAKLEADPDKATALTEDDVETRAEKKAQEKALIKEFNETVDRLAEGAQKHLKLKTKEFDALVEEVTEELGAIPSQIIGILGDLDNGPVVLAHLFKNPDDAEDIYKLKDRPAKLGLELAKLSTKLSTPTPKKISQVPDPIEPLGGKSAGSDRLTFLTNKKNKTPEEMAEYVQARNADVASKRATGRYGLR